MTAARMCEQCGLKPQAYADRRYCYDCKPGHKGRPLPCRRCGSTDDYWSSGLCRRCHTFAPQLPDACLDCLAWGVYRLRGWLCGGCQSWRDLHPQHGQCISCGRQQPLNNKRACRLCWQQTVAQAERGEPRDVLKANRHGQQLMFANMSSSKPGFRPQPRHGYRHEYRRPSDPSTGPTTPKTTAALPGQLDLFAFRPIEDAALRYGFGDPPSSHFAVLLDRLTVDHANQHGWTRQQTAGSRIALRVLQARHQIHTAPIKATDVTSLTDLGLRPRNVLTVLRTNGLLEDDRPASIETWFTRQTRLLPQPMARELRTWFTILREGSTKPPRSRPRHTVTIKTRVLWALPTLRAWAAEGHHSLREITRADVLLVLPADGTARATLGAALRSIFSTLKRHNVLFTNPMARISVGNVERRIPMPLNQSTLQEAFHSPDPTRAALTALIGFHGLRPREARYLRLTDIRDGRIWLPDRTILLAPATRQRLDTYLRHRQATWPGSANPHWFINNLSATTTEPVWSNWPTDRLGMSAQALRQDRIVDEIQADGDLRRICDFFGVTMNTAEYYTITVSHPELGRGTNKQAVGPPTPAPG
ncbi:MAG: hypothetical protein M3Z00_07055 [Actinomycetota bacterium]|nr:hypothetical protein [Actinomycetota bacterium]